MNSFAEIVLRYADPRRRAAVAAAFSGPGIPAGVRGCEERGEYLIISVDVRITPLALVRHFADVEARRLDRHAAAAGEPGDERMARLVAEAIGDPGLDAGRILEVRVPELDAGYGTP